MKKSKKVLIIIGIILIILQTVSFVGMSTMYVGLFPKGEDLLYPTRVNESDFDAQKAMFAIEAGFDRFLSGFEDLTYGTDKYRIMTPTQITSAMIRESLNCSSGGSSGLTTYDLILATSYNFTGIIGIVLLLVSSRIKNNRRSTNEETQDDADDAKYLQEQRDYFAAHPEIKVNWRDQ